MMASRSGVLEFALFYLKGRKIADAEEQVVRNM
jgi:hypothetical protein